MFLFPRRLPSCRALLRRALLVLEGSFWSIISAIKAVIWAVWESAAKEKALDSSEMSDVNAVDRERGQETSSGVIWWKLEEKPADPVVSAVSRLYF